MQTPEVAVAVLFPLVAAVISTAAFAQPAPTTNYTSFEASPPVQLGYYASAHKDCTPAPLPKIRAVGAPKSGTLTVRRGELPTDKIAGCPDLKTSAQIVFYQARAGSDHGGGRWCAIATQIPRDRSTTDC
jgi:hypothetical protein